MNLLSLFPLGAPVLVGAWARDCVAWAMLGATRRNTTKGKLAPQGHRTTSVIHVCKWRDIQTCIVLVDVCWELYMHVCVCVCVYCVCAHSTSYLHTHIAWLRLPKKRKHRPVLLCNVELRREAATRLLEAASACSTAGGETRTFGASVSCPGANYMDAWPALCTALGHVLAYPYRVLLRTNSRLCPSSREPWRTHCDRVSSIVRLVETLGPIGLHWRVHFPDATRCRSRRRRRLPPASPAPHPRPGPSTSPESRIS